eukprot:TRINITY_DN97399_c0_g1_i1.p3 TRINITY_DN97399_c0_g1~~TRINITY_DN97399_c0_g1_i1.p3  ORF type:complete len:101 (-),score=3.66 TRINITY_DN97399_c0_g1_i1:687-989(-)
MITENSILELYKKIAKNVQQKRLDCGKTQLDIAYNALELNNDSFVSKLENCGEGKHFNIEQLYRIANYLECDLCEFFKGVKYAQSKQSRKQPDISKRETT